MKFQSFNQLMTTLVERVTAEDFIQGTVSQPRQKSNNLKRVRLKLIALKDRLYIQFEYQYERILKHENILLSEVHGAIEKLANDFRQFHLQFVSSDVHIMISKKFKVMWKEQSLTKPRQQQLAHNRQKQYILDEATVHPFLVRLGVQTKEGKIRKKYYDKFRQINRFLEFVEDSLPYLPKEQTIRILDFGSGKSYLTFALYHYLNKVKKLDVHITGLDLKKEVIEFCSTVARDLNYENLEFLVGDINEYDAVSEVDMIVTLHACNTATDMALGRAVRWGAKVILSVPCCQHELFDQLNAKKLNVMLQHGLIKERFSALATDAMRAEILGLVGYEVQLLEFIDMEHTPKNILIRAYFTGRQATKADKEKYINFRNMLGAKPYLERELQDRLNLGNEGVF